MATLNFTKKGNYYEAEATINKDYALHVEREGNGFFYMEQCSTADGKFADCALPANIANGYWNTLDYTFGHGYYPMKVKFKSVSAVTKAEYNEIAEG